MSPDGCVNFLDGKVHAKPCNISQLPSPTPLIRIIKENKLSLSSVLDCFTVRQSIGSFSNEDRLLHDDPD